MRDWMKLFENDDDETPEERESSARYAREQAVEAEVKSQCERLGWSFLDHSYPVTYDEAEGEITLKPDDEEVTLAQLEYLKKYGSDVKVMSVATNSLMITIKGLRLR